MPTPAELLAIAKANRSPERRFAALITLEAVAPEGTLEDPELLAGLTEGIDGRNLSRELLELSGRGEAPFLLRQFPKPVPPLPASAK